MKWWVVIREEWSGYDCSGHWVKHIVAAVSENEARKALGENPHEEIKECYELVLPKLERKRKSFVLF